MKDLFEVNKNTGIKDSEIGMVIVGATGLCLYFFARAVYLYLTINMGVSL